MKSGEEAVRAEVGLLDNVFGILFPANQPAGKVVRRMQMRQYHLLKARALLGVRQTAISPLLLLPVRS